MVRATVESDPPGTNIRFSVLNQERRWAPERRERDTASRCGRLLWAKVSQHWAKDLIYNFIGEGLEFWSDYSLLLIKTTLVYIYVFQGAAGSWHNGGGGGSSHQVAVSQDEDPQLTDSKNSVLSLLDFPSSKYIPCMYYICKSTLNSYLLINVFLYVLVEFFKNST